MVIDRVEIIKTKSPHFKDISIRDWLAGQAMPVLIAECEEFEDAIRLSYELADKMIEAGKDGS